MSVKPDYPATDLMAALVIERPGEPAALRPRRVAAPTCRAGEVIVRVEAAGVNPSDLLNFQGLPLTTYPRIPGRDFAGIVVAGPDTLVGSQVWGTGSGDLGFTRDGTHAQYVALPATAAVRLPTGFTLADAGGSGLAYATAAAGLAEAEIADGTRVLVTGAAGAVGGAAAAIARHRGADVIAAVKDSFEEERAARSLPGAYVVRTDENFNEAVHGATADHGVDIVFDTVGTVLFRPLLAALAEDGEMIVISAQPGIAVELDLSQFYRRRLTLRGVSSTRADAVWCAGMLRGLLPGFESGELPPVPIAQLYALSDAEQAYAHVASGAVVGRVLLTPFSERRDL